MQACFLLRAHHPPRNIDRFYHIYIGRTLFNDYALLINHGRTGLQGRTKAFYYQAREALEQHLQHILKRRFNAKGRLGTNYAVIDQSFDEEFDTHIWQELKIKLLRKKSSLLS